MLVKTDIPEIQVDKIINELGEFDASQGQLKMYARRGQCFTTTKYITKLEPSQLELIDDIERPKEDEPDEKYCFTDGCGNISIPLCEMINEKFGLLQCSAY